MEENYQMDKLIEKKEKTITLCWIMLISGFFVVLFSLSTSPILSKYFCYDSAIFQVVGKAWANGIIPYSNCFDHKGSLLFLINAIGYKVGIGKAGVCFVQWIFMSVSFFVLYLAARIYLNRLTASLVVLASYFILSITYGQGNLSEEYSLIFIISSIYLGMKYIKNVEEKGIVNHPFCYAVWYGVSFTSILFLRVTNGVAICCLIFVICILLIKDKKFVNLLQNACAFLAGACILFIPFSVYYYLKNSWYDMIFGTIIYNVLYASESAMVFDKSVLVGLFSGFLLMIVSVLHIICTKKTKDILGMYSFFTATLSLIMFTQMNGYGHYYMITLPYFMISVIFIKDIYNSKIKSKVIKRCLVCGLGCFVFIQMGLAGYKTVRQIKEYQINKNYQKEYLEFCQYFNQYIPSEEKEDVLTFGRNSLSSWYLVNDVNPPYKYCFVQDWQAKNSEKMTKEILAHLNENPEKWLITNADYDTKEILMNYDQEFKNIIIDKYDYIDSYTVKQNFETYNLYKLK